MRRQQRVVQDEGRDVVPERESGDVVEPRVHAGEDADSPARENAAPHPRNYYEPRRSSVLTLPAVAGSSAVCPDYGRQE